MNKFSTTTLIGLAAIGSLLLASATADAHPYQRSGARVGIYVGAGILAAPWVYGRPYYGPYAYPYNYGPYAYPYSYSYSYSYSYPYYGYAPVYYPRVVVQEQPTDYVESQAPVAIAPPAPPASSVPQAQQQYWYFCRSSQTYYPHVQNCPTPWQRVIPHAPQ